MHACTVHAYGGFIGRVPEDVLDCGMLTSECDV